MDKVDKILSRISVKEKVSIKAILNRIQSGNFKGLDIKKLKGRQDIFRVRKGKIRIIYRLNTKRKIYILTIERRSEKIYKF